MTAPTMRRLALTLLALLGVLLAPAPTVSAQEPEVVHLTLLEQTAWNSSFDEVNARELLVRFRAENLGSVAIGDLAIGVTLYGRVLSRTAFEDSLLSDPSLALKAETRPREGTIEPGETRDFELTFLLDDSAGLDPDDSGIYPLKIDLRSGFTSLGAIRTPVVFLVRQPVEPLRLSWTFVLHHPIEFGPDGEFTSTELETALAPGGRLGARIRALLELSRATTQPAVDVAVSPVLLTQLARMRDGYEVRIGDELLPVEAGEGGAKLAEDALTALVEIADAPNVRVSAMPFSAPELPSLVAGGLGRDLGIQLDRGREIVTDMLGTTPVAGILRPPGAALDDATLRELHDAGVSTLVVGPSTVQADPQPLGFAGPPTASLSESGALRAVVPDPSVAALLQSGLASTDPVLGAQVVLGEIASIWQEQPSELRGVALVMSEESLLPASFFLAFTRSIASAPWLTPMHAGEFATTFPPDEPSTLLEPSFRRFSTNYVEELKQARRHIATYRSMLVEPGDEPDRLETLLLLAESRQYLSTPEDGLAFIDGVRDSVGAVFGAISVESAPVITLTSSTGSGVPVTVRNDADEALRVSVQLESLGLSGTPTIDLELPPGDEQTITFRVDLVRTGRFEVQLRVLAPAGRVIQPAPGEEPLTLVLRSTVYNRIALVITIAAALVLLALWARRFLPRRTS
jgi:uncharacterized protein DUF6049